MRREIKLIIWVFVLVVGPAIAVSFLAARVLESWQIVLQKRMAGEAGHVLDEAVAVWDRELASLRVKPASFAIPAKAQSVYFGDLSLQHLWVKGFFLFQPGVGLVYPAEESSNPKFDRNESGAEGERLLAFGGAHLAKGDTNSAMECFEQVGGVSTQNWESSFGQRDSEEGFFYDLVALEEMIKICEAQGQIARVAEIQLKVLERVLSRYDDLVPLQRDSMVEWVEAARKADGKGLMGDGKAGGLYAQWHERMRGRALGPEERARLVNGISMIEPTIPDSGWITMSMKQAHLLVTKILPLEGPPFVFALEYSEFGLMEHWNALFAVTASNTEIRVCCQGGGEEKVGPILASRRLSSPFDAISLVATPENVPAFVANVRLQTRLYQWGGLLLLISVVAGVWLVWREAASEIRQARERTNFAAAVSHDLRTPLSSMRMLAESMYMGNVTDESKRKKFLGAIIKESDRLSRLTDRALYFIRYGQGALRYQFAEGDLGGLVREAVDTFAVGVGALRVNGKWLMVKEKEAGEKEQILIEFDFPPDFPPVRFDAGAMEQVVYNLLDNAVKYSRRDGAVQIEVRLAMEAGTIILSVHDHGAGMTPEEVRQILKPYARGKNAGRQNARGIGLGLALCQHVVQAHGGRIQIQSELGKGSQFSVVLPV